MSFIARRLVGRKPAARLASRPLARVAGRSMLLASSSSRSALVASRSRSFLVQQFKPQQAQQHRFFAARPQQKNKRGNSNNEERKEQQEPLRADMTAVVLGALAGACGAAAIVKFLAPSDGDSGADIDVKQLKEDLMDLMESDPTYDVSGSFGPLFVRLAWHASGTFCRHTKTGGSDGATMRFSPEADDGANAGLHIARNKLEVLKAKYPGLSTADLWTYAGAVAIEAMGGPVIPFRFGRSDKPSGKHCPPVGRLPDAAQGAAHVRDVFYRMGFNDREIVALSGAHALGRCHTDRSGFKGPWTRAPTTFSNEYFRLLLEEKWTKKKWDGPLQYEDSTGDLMMLPTDMSLVWDPEFKKIVELYSRDEDAFFNDFSAAFGKLLELGCTFK